MTSIFSPIGEQQSTVESEVYLDEEFRRKPNAINAIEQAQEDRDEIPIPGRFINDLNDPDLVNGNSIVPRITIRPRPAHDNVGLLQQARQSFRNELNKYNTPLMRDDQGNIIGEHERLKQNISRKAVEDFIARQTGKDIPEFDEP